MSATVQLLSFQWCGIQTYKNLSCEKTKVSNHMPPPVCKMAACFKMYRLTQKNQVTVPLSGERGRLEDGEAGPSLFTVFSLVVFFFFFLFFAECQDCF